MDLATGKAFCGISASRAKEAVGWKSEEPHQVFTTSRMGIGPEWRPNLSQTFELCPFLVKVYILFHQKMSTLKFTKFLLALSCWNFRVISKAHFLTFFFFSPVVRSSSNGISVPRSGTESGLQQ